MSNEQKCWDFLMLHIANPYGVAGLMGNIKAESNFIPNNLQNSYEKKLGFTDETYTQAVDSGSYTKAKFVTDSAGYGICQWTYWLRKQKLYESSKSQELSIGSLDMQLNFLIDELMSYNLIDKLRTSKSVRESSDLILKHFEKPADQSENACIRRAGYGQDIYNRLAGETKTENVSERIKELVNELSELINKI